MDVRAKIARCEEEIRRVQSRPDDVPEPAWLVALGIRDWQAEIEWLRQYHADS
jgi:hypothetical protein